MKTSNPYTASITVKTPTDIVPSELSKASGKAKARYPHTPKGVNVSGGGSGPMKHRANTPGGPTGS